MLFFTIGKRNIWFDDVHWEGSVNQLQKTNKKNIIKMLKEQTEICTLVPSFSWKSVARLDSYE